MSTKGQSKAQIPRHAESKQRSTKAMGSVDNLSIQGDILYFPFDAKKTGSTPAYTMGLLREL